MNDCVSVLRTIGRSCNALNAIAGADKRVWITQLSQIESYTRDSDGYLNSLVMATDGSAQPYELITVTGKKNKNSGANELQVNDNNKLFNQTAIVYCYPDTPTKRAALEALCQSDEIVVFIETEKGQIEVFGMDRGLEASAMTGGTGTATTDDTGFSVTFTGAQTRTSDFFLVGGTLATSIAYLDGITSTS